MYWHMTKGDDNAAVNRGIAPHKMIRLVTLATINGGYLNFMGKSSVIPNGLISRAKVMAGAISMHAASGILSTARSCATVSSTHLTTPWCSLSVMYMISRHYLSRNYGKRMMTRCWPFKRGDLVFVFNWAPFKSYDGYGFPCSRRGI